MKVDLFKIIIAVATALLLAYASYEICNSDSVRWVITIGSFITLVVPLTLAVGVLSKNEKGALVLSIISWIMFFVEAVVNICFVFTEFSIPTYVVINGLLFLIYLLLYSSIFKARV